jgi:hypothetical protein
VALQVLVALVAVVLVLTVPRTAQLGASILAVVVVDQVTQAQLGEPVVLVDRESLS